MQNDFSQGSVGRNILMQAIPLTIAQLIQLLYNVVDRIYIGHLPDANGLALTGIGLAFPLIALITAFTSLFGMGGSPLCSIARGKGDIEEAEHIMGTTLWLLVVSSFFITIFCYLFKKPILYLFGASDLTYVYANDYLSIYLLGTMFAMIGPGMNYFINLQGFPKIGMGTTILGAVLNIVLDPLFIFVFKMGIRGAAIATVIAQIASAIWVLCFILGKKAILRLRREYFRFDFPRFRQICALGLSGFIMSATNCVVQIACNSTLSIYGGDLYIGIMTVINSVRDIIMLPVSGITNGSQPVLGFNYGAKEYGRVRKGIVFTLILGSIYSLAAWLMVLLFPTFFMGLFSSDPSIIQHGSEALKIYFFGFIMMVFQAAGQCTFVGLGKSKQAIFFSILRKIIIVVPLTLILPRIGFGVNGVFIAEPVSNILGGLLCYGTMMATVWRQLKRDEEALKTQ
ncbi:MAG: MATE family efflux transporter [Candidatus Merdivicinus sp.]|jgi:putative MATE family efflux protein